MIERALSVNNCRTAIKITVKSAVSLVLIALAVGLPLIIHVAVGKQGGVTWLPMYLPILLGGCILGMRWGVTVGAIAPIVSYLITLAIGDPMPAATRLPYMMAELVAAAAVTGYAADKIAIKGAIAFPAIALGLIAGRLTLLVLGAIFAPISQLNAAAALSQIRAGLAGAIAQIIVLPLIIIALRRMLLRDDKR